MQEALSCVYFFFSASSAVVHLTESSEQSAYNTLFSSFQVESVVTTHINISFCKVLPLWAFVFFSERKWQSHKQSYFYYMVFNKDWVSVWGVGGSTFFFFLATVYLVGVVSDCKCGLFFIPYCASL